MAKFGSIRKGKKARKIVEVPLLHDVEGEGGSNVVPVALVPLWGEDELEVLESAKAFARAHGEENPKAGEPIFERGLWIHTVLRTVMDADVPDKNEPFFDSAEQILKFLDPDRISLLFHAQRAWQARCAPPQANMTDVEYIRHVVELQYAAEEEARTGESVSIPFDSLPLVTQLRFTRRLASQFGKWVELNSLSGSSSPDTSPTTPSSAPSSTAEARLENSAPTGSPSTPHAPPLAPPSPPPGPSPLASPLEPPPSTSEPHQDGPRGEGPAPDSSPPASPPAEDHPADDAPAAPGDEDVTLGAG